MNKRWLAGAVVFLGTVLTACAGHGGYYAGYGPPPAPRYGARGYAPGPGYVWTDGYWDRQGNRWQWRDGRWMRPPHRNARWQPGRWVETGHGRWRFERGRWR